MHVGRRKIPEAVGADIKRPSRVIICATYVSRDEGLLQTQDLCSAYDASQRQKPLRDGHLDRFHEAASVEQREQSRDEYSDNQAGHTCTLLSEVLLVQHAWGKA